MPTALQGPPVAAARPQLWRVTDRRTFQALRQRGPPRPPRPAHGHLARPAPRATPTPPRVGFAIGRPVGGAVRAQPDPPAPAGRPARAPGRRPAARPAPTCWAAAPTLAELPWSDAGRACVDATDRRGPVDEPASPAPCTPACAATAGSPPAGPPPAGSTPAAPPTPSRPWSATAPPAAPGSPSGASPGATRGAATAGTPSLNERRTDVRRPLRALRRDPDFFYDLDPELRDRHRAADAARDGHHHAVHAQGHPQHDPDAAAPAGDAASSS